MDEQSKVVSIRQFKTRRRLKSLKSKLSSPITLIIGALMVVFGIGSITYTAATKENLTHGLSGAKAEFLQYNPGPFSPTY